MLFSITIAAYNAEKYLDQCINDIFRQTFDDYEIVIVNDCSTDRTGEKCEELAAKYPDKIRVFHHSVNKGLLLARRTTFQHAKGQWIICVDADDVLLPNALEELNNVINKHDCDMVLYNLECRYENGKTDIFDAPLKEDYVYSDKKDIFDLVLKNNNLNSMCTKAVKREVIDFDTDYDIWEPVRVGTDIFQSLPLFDNAKSIVYLNKVLYYYIKTPNSITTKFKENLYIQKLLFERYEHFYGKWGYSDKDLEKLRIYWIKVFVNLINYYYKFSKIKKNKKYYNDYINSLFNDDYVFALCGKVDTNKLNFIDKMFLKLIKSRNKTLIYVLSAIKDKIL